MISAVQSCSLAVWLALVTAMGAASLEPKTAIQAQATEPAQINQSLKIFKIPDESSKTQPSTHSWFGLHFRTPKAGEWPRVGHRGP
jgi:hypothetical protein